MCNATFTREILLDIYNESFCKKEDKFSCSVYEIVGEFEDVEEVLRLSLSEMRYIILNIYELDTGIYLYNEVYDIEQRKLRKRKVWNNENVLLDKLSYCERFHIRFEFNLDTGELQHFNASCVYTNTKIEVLLG